MNKIILFLDHLYETINIYQTIIIYDKNNYKYDIYKLIKILSSKDYPICMVDNYTEDIQKKENKFRVFIMDSDTFFNHYIQIKNLDLIMISAIMCLDKISYDKISTFLNLNNSINLANEVYIFSIDNI
jgi:hypothetical protein